MVVMGAERFDRVWRPRGSSLVMGWVLGGVAALLALAGLAALLAGSAEVGSALMVVLVNVLVAVAAWRWGTHPLLGADDVGVTVRNPLRTTVVPWDDVIGCGATGRGVTLLRRSGPPLVAWAVQKPTLAAWAGRRTLADDVVAYLVDRASGGDGTGTAAAGEPGRGNGSAAHDAEPDRPDDDRP
jgi:hypothetical protein